MEQTSSQPSVMSCAECLELERVELECLNSECLESFLVSSLDAKYITDGFKDKRSFDDVIDFLVGYLSQNPRFYDESNEFQPFSGEEAIRVLKPNLICALLEDNRFGPKTYSLNEMISKTDTGLLSPSQASRHPLKNFPKAFRRLS